MDDAEKSSTRSFQVKLSIAKDKEPPQKFSHKAFGEKLARLVPKEAYSYHTY